MTRYVVKRGNFYYADDHWTVRWLAASWRSLSIAKGMAAVLGGRVEVWKRGRGK